MVGFNSVQKQLNFYSQQEDFQPCCIRLAYMKETGDGEADSLRKAIF